ncbi:uncharacterized protein LOC103723650 isoform X1 [Phoenix dactylifera]|uniref:Uncharacterized protein LOC103723650 isoform X1 n=1 Tax=Phoenix dactylifera TaxID=42345 RepID=A0A8B7D497_PHODC|nr:uncharacterized protein LOC103723650 isoform X1 [Phoenix dactylifera]
MTRSSVSSRLVSSFLVGQTADTATQFLEVVRGLCGENALCRLHCGCICDKTLVPKYTEAVQTMAATLEDTEGPIRLCAIRDEPKHEKVAETRKTRLSCTS